MQAIRDLSTRADSLKPAVFAARLMLLRGVQRGQIADQVPLVRDLASKSIINLVVCFEW